MDRIVSLNGVTGNVETLLLGYLNIIAKTPALEGSITEYLSRIKS
jgi:hypothetical protein